MGILGTRLGRTFGHSFYRRPNSLLLAEEETADTR